MADIRRGPKRKNGQRRRKQMQRPDKYEDEQKEMDALIEKCSMEVRLLYRVWHNKRSKITRLVEGRKCYKMPFI